MYLVHGFMCARLHMGFTCACVDAAIAWWQHADGGTDVCEPFVRAATAPSCAHLACMHAWRSYSATLLAALAHARLGAVKYLYACMP